MSDDNEAVQSFTTIAKKKVSKWLQHLDCAEPADQAHSPVDMYTAYRERSHKPTDQAPSPVDMYTAYRERSHDLMDPYGGHVEALRGHADPLRGHADTLRGHSDPLRVHPDTLRGQLVDPLRGQLVDPLRAQLVDPLRGHVLDPLQAQMVRDRLLQAERGLALEELGYDQYDQYKDQYEDQRTQLLQATRPHTSSPGRLAPRSISPPRGPIQSISPLQAAQRPAHLSTQLMSQQQRELARIEELERELECERKRRIESELSRERRDYGRPRDRSKERNRSKERDRSKERNRSKERDKERERDRHREREEREREREQRERQREKERQQREKERQEREHERQERERERERARERVRQQQLHDKFKEDVECPVSGAPLDYINKSYDIAGKMLSDDKKQRIFHAQKKKEATQRKLTAVTKTKSATKIPTTKDQRLLIPEKRQDQLTLLQEFGVDTDIMDDMSLQMWLDYVQQWHTYYLNQVKARKDVDLTNVQIRIKVQIQAQIQKEYLNQSKATVEQAQQPTPGAMMMGPQGYMPPYGGAPGYMGPIRFPGPGMDGYYGGGTGGGYMGPPGYMSRPRFRRGFPPRGRGDFGNPRFRGFREPGPHHGNRGPRGPYNGPHQPVSDQWGEVDMLQMTGGGEEIPEVVMDINSNVKEGDYTASQSEALKTAHSGGESGKRSRSPQAVPPPDDEGIPQHTDNNNSQNKKLTSHATKADSGTNDFHCHACSTKCHSLQDFDEHMKGSTHRQRMQDIYSLQQRAQQHLTQRNKPQSSTKEADSREFCSICDRHFHGTFLFHKKTDEHKRKDRLTRKGCILCKTGSFVKYPDYVTHIDSAYHKQRKRTNLPVKPAWFHCDICAVCFDSPDAFVLHRSTLKHHQKKEQLAKDLASRTDGPQVKGQQEAEGQHGEEGEGHSGSPKAPQNPVPVEEQMDASGIYEEEPDRQPPLCDDRKSSASIIPIITTAAAELSYDPHISIGLEFVLPVTGYFCKLCSRFYNNEEMAKGTHCKTERHFQLYQKALESYQKQQASTSLQNGLTAPSRSPITINKHLTTTQLGSCGPPTPINQHLTTTQTPNKSAPVSSKSRTTGRPSSDKVSVKPASIKDCDSHKDLIKPGQDKDSHKDVMKPGQDKDSHKDIMKPGQDKDSHKDIMKPGQDKDSHKDIMKPGQDSCRDSLKPELHRDSIKPDTNQPDQDMKPTTSIKSSSSSDKQDRNDKDFYQPLENTLALQTKKNKNQDKISDSKVLSGKSQGAEKKIPASAAKTKINETDSGSATNGNTANKPKVTSSNGSSANSNPMVSSTAKQTTVNKPKVRSTTNGNTSNKNPQIISFKANPGVDPSKTSCDKAKILSDSESPESQDSMVKTVAPPELVLAPPQSLTTKTSLSSKVKTVAPPETLVTSSEPLSGTALLHGSALEHKSVIKKRTGVIRKSGPASFQAKKVALGAAKNTVLTNFEVVVVLDRVESKSSSWPDDSSSTSESTIINQAAKQDHDSHVVKQSSRVDSYSSSVNKLIPNNVNQSCRRKETMTPFSLKSPRLDRSPTCERSNSDTDSFKSVKSSQTTTENTREQLSEMVDELMDDTAREVLQEEILQVSHADKQHDTNYDTDNSGTDSVKSSQTATENTREQLSEMVDELMDDTAREVIQEEILQVSHADKQCDTNYDTDTAREVLQEEILQASQADKQHDTNYDTDTAREVLQEEILQASQADKQHDTNYDTDTAREVLQEEILQASQADKQHDTNYDTDTNDVDMDLDTASEVSAKILDADGIDQVKKMVDNTGENRDTQGILQGRGSCVDNIMMVGENQDIMTADENQDIMTADVTHDTMTADETHDTRSDIEEGLDEDEDSDTEDKVSAIEAEDDVGSNHGEDDQAGGESDHGDELEEEILGDEYVENDDETGHYDEDELSDETEHYDDAEVIDRSGEVTNEPRGEDFQSDHQSPHDLDQVDGIIETESRLVAGNIVKTCENGEAEDNCVLEKMSDVDSVDKNDSLKPLEENTKQLVLSQLDSYDLDYVVSASEQKLIPAEITQISLSLDKDEALEDREMQAYGKDLNENVGLDSKSNTTTRTQVSDPSSESEQSVSHKSEKNETDTRTGSETNGKTRKIRKRRFAPDFDELVNINSTLKKHSKGRMDKSDNQSINKPVNLHPSLSDKTHGDWENQEHSSGLHCETNDAGEFLEGKSHGETRSYNSLKSGGKIPINISCDALSSPKRRLRKK